MNKILIRNSDELEKLSNALGEELPPPANYPVICVYMKINDLEAIENCAYRYVYPIEFYCV